MSSILERSLVACAAGLLACGGGDPSAPACPSSQVSSASASALTTAQTRFAMSIYLARAKGATDNVVLSPYSVWSTFTMLAGGAARGTASQMQTVLSLPDSPDNLAPTYAAQSCRDEGAAGSGNALSVANAIWVDDAITVRPAFLSLLANGYGSPVQRTDFKSNSTAAAAGVDDWVANHTGGQIGSLLSPSDVSAGTELVVAAAVYFRGTWAAPFDAGKTSSRAFALADGTSADVPTMSGTVTLRTGQANGVGVYELPYSGNQLVMDLFEPDGSLRSLEAGLSYEQMTGWMAALGQPQPALVSIPKFSFRTRLDLRATLRGMGMADAFDPGMANFSGIDGQTDLYVRTAIHEATVAVDERGTIASGATAAGVSLDGSASATIDRPFLFLIRNIGTGSVLFVGRVEDPRQTGGP